MLQQNKEYLTKKYNEHKVFKTEFRGQEGKESKCSNDPFQSPDLNMIKMLSQDL